MKSIRDELNHLGYSIPDNPGDFGIEIETEVKDKRNYPNGFLVQVTGLGDQENPHHMWNIPSLPDWRGHADNSLRDFGVEYVLKKPLDYAAADKALKEFGEKTSGVRFHMDSAGTSVHVHTNLAKYDWRILGNYLTTYTLYEDVLSVFAGPSRTSNLFALPMRCAQENHDLMVDIFTSVAQNSTKGIQRLNDEAFKYAAMNLSPLRRLGSLECRLMRGTTNPSELRLWLKVLNELLEFSKSDFTPKDIIAEFRDIGDPFMKYVFKETHRYLPDPSRYVTDRSVFYAGWLSACVDDWRNLGFVISESKKKKSASTAWISPYPTGGYTVTQLVEFGYSAGQISNAMSSGQTLATPHGMVKYHLSSGKFRKQVAQPTPQPAYNLDQLIADGYIVGHQQAGIVAVADEFMDYQED